LFRSHGFFNPDFQDFPWQGTRFGVHLRSIQSTPDSPDGTGLHV
jgi:hypothetical protein